MYRVEKVLTHSNYFIRKIGTLHTQLVHRIRLRKIVPQTEIHDIQQVNARDFIPDPSLSKFRSEPDHFDHHLPYTIFEPPLPITDDGQDTTAAGDDVVYHTGNLDGGIDTVPTHFPDPTIHRPDNRTNNTQSQNDLISPEGNADRYDFRPTTLRQRNITRNVTFALGTKKGPPETQFGHHVQIPENQQNSRIQKRETLHELLRTQRRLLGPQPTAGRTLRSHSKQK